MAAQEQQTLLNLFDSYWFYHPVFTKTKNPSRQTAKYQQSAMETAPNLDFSAVQTLNVRSYSDNLFLTTKQHTFITDSPKSVLNPPTPKLQTILSGEVGEFEETEEVKVKVNSSVKVKEKRRKGKSLSELEFEELKGFMDLGFVFSEKDKGSSLGSIIPGLQRLGKDDEKEYVSGASRPYLSESWEVLESQRKLEEKKALVPMIMIDSALGNEVEIKHQLRFWAHSVASAVR